MWTERQCRDRRIGSGEILCSWAIIALIVVSLAAWAGFQALTADSDAPVIAERGGG
jgi:hypothetical protein